MAALSALQRRTRRQLMPGIRLASPMAALPAKTLPARVKALPVKFTLPIYVIHRETRFAHSIVWVNPSHQCEK
jgi:hypothetical protein